MTTALLVPCCSDGKCPSCEPRLTPESARALAEELTRLSPGDLRVDVLPPDDGPAGHDTTLCFTGGPYGRHVLCAGCSTRSRVAKHWEGYVAVALEVRWPTAVQPVTT